MNPFPRYGCALAFIVVGMLTAPQPMAAQADDRCTEWTDWTPVHPLPVLFSWRMCRAAANRYDIQWRFANNGSQAIELHYELYTGMVTVCGEQNRGRVFTKGKYRLAADQWDERYSGRKTLRSTGFEQRFWLYACLLPVPTDL